MLLLALLMAASGAWATLALAIAGPHVAWMRIGPAVLAGLATVAFLAALMIPRWRWKAVQPGCFLTGRRAGLVVRHEALERSRLAAERGTHALGHGCG
ncbi:MAG: hypothetical protein IPL15_21375 [Comamonadaceae bacterium]|uniref:hypothetical protein n=1 Tax=Candidatus Skiveiella danica TaxID=3386177 RepID=UPI00390B915A|nr:hypothetical protein [Comamonadaceae bacterium]